MVQHKYKLPWEGSFTSDAIYSDLKDQVILKAGNHQQTRYELVVK